MADKAQKSTDTDGLEPVHLCIKVEAHGVHVECDGAVEGWRGKVLLQGGEW